MLSLFIYQSVYALISHLCNIQLDYWNKTMPQDAIQKLLK